MAPALDIPPHSYGSLIATTVRIVTWNVWGLYGPWQEREAAIVATLQDAHPDIVVLTESWAKGADSQCVRLARPLDMPHHTFSGVAAQEDETALSGVAVMSRWPISSRSGRTFGAVRVEYAEVSRPRGPIRVYGVVMDAWWFDESRARQDAVRNLLAYVHESQDERIPLVVCGDFNADPESDEIRMLSGRTTAPVPGLSFYDAWEVAGPADAGFTWSNANPWATQLLWPDRRIDYIFSAAPRRGGAGHPLGATLLGSHPVDGTYPSDHYGVQADVRYGWHRFAGPDWSSALVLWSTRDDLEDLYGDPLTIWQDWAVKVAGHGIDSGHHMAEQAPGALTKALIPFLAPAP